MILQKFNEFYRAKWNSSIKEEDIIDLIPIISKIQNSISKDQSNVKYIKSVESNIVNYDTQVSDFIIDLFFYQDIIDEEYIIDEIIELGDIIMNKYGTEPRQVINALQDTIDFLSWKIGIDE